MKILILAPQPFFRERGTPIAVRLMLECLTNRYSRCSKADINLLTYGEGENISLSGVVHHRSWEPKLIHSIPPGLSIKKLIADIFFAGKLLALLWKNRKSQFHLVHAIEESVFLAVLVKFFLGVPYIYDMDSSLSRQATESWKFLKLFRPWLKLLAKVAIKKSFLVVPMCESLAESAKRCGAKAVKVLHDVALISPHSSQEISEKNDLRERFDLPANQALVMYVGNFHPSQGVELLIQSFSQLDPELLNTTSLILIGGTAAEIERLEQLRNSYSSLNRQNCVCFTGSLPFAHLASYLNQSQILASPRVSGENTPMKIYNYLISGRPIIATKIESHLQVLSDKEALLCAPDSEDFSLGLKQLLSDPSLQHQLGCNGQLLALDKYTRDSFELRLNGIYDWCEKELGLKPPKHE